MILALIGRYPERPTLRRLRVALHEAGHEVRAAWIDGPEQTDHALTDEQAARQARQNCLDLMEAHAAIYLPSSMCSVGRHVDLGMAYALALPLYVLAASWDDLPAPDQTIYLRGPSVRWCRGVAALLVALGEGR